MTLKGKTVLQILPSLEEGGAEKCTLEVAAALRDQQTRALVVSSGGAKTRSIGTHHIKLPVDTKNPLEIWRNSMRLTGLFEEENVDLVHAHSRAPAWSSRSAARRSDIPFVTTWHGNYNGGSALKRTYNRIMVQGERVIAVSNFVAEQISTLYAFPSSHIRVIYPGVDTKAFDPASVVPQAKATLRASWNIPEDAHIILLPARLTRLKGHALLIEAMRRLGDKTLVVVFVGSWQSRQNYRRELEALARDQPIRVVGHVEDMPTAYAVSSVVVSPSRRPESFGMVLAEAGAMGVPTVSNDHGGAREIVLHGDTGWLVQANDADALANGIRSALMGAGPCLAAKARAHVLEHFSRERMCADTLAVYRELL